MEVKQWQHRHPRRPTLLVKMSHDPSKYGPLDQQEDFEDLNLAGDWFHGAVLWSTDWTTETILAQLRRRNIDLNPKYQRRAAWDARRKSTFIESLIMGLPIPQIILAEDHNKKGAFIVIDGKQRLLALSQFAARDGDPFDVLALTGLSDRPDLAGKRYTDLQTDPDFLGELNTFDNQTIRTVVIRNWQDERYLYSVFLRINTGSQPLSPQELRQAIAPGPFSDFLDDYAVTSIPLQEALGLTKPDFRMRDNELALRFFAYKNNITNYTGSLKQFLDRFTIQANGDWAAIAPELQQQAIQLNYAITLAKDIFGERNYLRKWNGENYEPRINRAVFDIITYYFSTPKIATAAANFPEEIRAAFERLCETNEDFRSALEATTKSMAANAIRFSVWGHALQHILGENIVRDVPHLDQNRLVV